MDEQLLFHLFDTLFKCFICLDLEIPQDKRPAFPAFLRLSRESFTNLFLSINPSQFRFIEFSNDYTGNDEKSGKSARK